MLKTVIAAVIATGGLSGAAMAQENDTLRVGMSGGYFPFTFVRQDELQGFEVDVMNAVGEEAGLDIAFETMSFSGLIGALEAGRIDTIANQITITPDREAAFAFTQPYVIDGAQVVTKAGNDEIEGVQDLRGRTVAVNLGSNFEQLLRELPYADEIDIKTYESNLEQDTALGRRHHRALGPDHGFVHVEGLQPSHRRGRDEGNIGAKPGQRLFGQKSEIAVEFRVEGAA